MPRWNSPNGFLDELDEMLVFRNARNVRLRGLQGENPCGHELGKVNRTLMRVSLSVRNLFQLKRYAHEESVIYCNVKESRIGSHLLPLRQARSLSYQF